MSEGKRSCLRRKGAFRESRRSRKNKGQKSAKFGLSKGEPLYGVRLLKQQAPLAGQEPLRVPHDELRRAAIHEVTQSPTLNGER